MGALEIVLGIFVSLCGLMCWLIKFLIEENKRLNILLFEVNEKSILAQAKTTQDFIDLAKQQHHVEVEDGA